MFLVFKKPFIYADAGYGVFSWVKGGVMMRMSFKKNSFRKNSLFLNYYILTKSDYCIKKFSILAQNIILMSSDSITYQNSGCFSKLIIDYLDEKPELQSLYNRFPKLVNFEAQIEEKKANYPNENRQILVSELEKQYSNITVSERTAQNIHSLKNPNTFTITTGHQLNLFTGPLYFLYKIISTLNLCKELNEKYPAQHFVPIYWMATEDHDFEEINYFNYNDKKIQWNRESKGAVGQLTTDELASVYEIFTKELGAGIHANYLSEVFEKAYVFHQNLADATRYLANELFHKEGLVIIDGDSTALKNLFVPYVKKELLEQTSFQEVTKTLPLFSGYTVQVNPRELNLFYLKDNLRERIIFENENFHINSTSIVFTKEEMLEELEKNPTHFSPNVLMRPVYQEVILPNLCYIGGGGEIAYWLQLKSTFEAYGLTFPMLLLRNSVLLATQKQEAKLAKLELHWADLFLPKQSLLDKKTKEKSKFTIDFTNEKEHLRLQFQRLHQIANQTDKSFLGAVSAQEKKQLKGLDTLEKRLLKAERRVLSEQLHQIEELQNELFPKGQLQERTANFAMYYEAVGPTIIDQLLLSLQPLEQNFTILIY
jgi:bacillithiol biosynthesis cysteine-adding enzyme BshC